MTDGALGTVHSYGELLAAFRARVFQLGISYSTVDQIAGWTDTYTTKLLAPSQMKGLAPMSFDTILGTLGLKLVLVEDSDALARVVAKMVRRKQAPSAKMLSAAKHGYIVLRLSPQHMANLGRRGNEARKQKLPQWKRRAIARKAAKARWARAAQAPSVPALRAPSKGAPGTWPAPSQDRGRPDLSNS